MFRNHILVCLSIIPREQLQFSDIACVSLSTNDSYLEVSPSLKSRNLVSNICPNDDVLQHSQSMIDTNAVISVNLLNTNYTLRPWTNRICQPTSQLSVESFTISPSNGHKITQSALIVTITMK